MDAILKKNTLKLQKCPWCEHPMTDEVINGKTYSKCESCQISFRNHGA